MRALIWVVVLLSALYGGYWFVGARATGRALQMAVDEAGQRGIGLAWQDSAVTGFPSRFDVTLDGPRVTVPAQGIGWGAEFAQVFALSYSPWKLIAALPDSQEITLPGQNLSLSTTRMRASLFMRPQLSLPLDDFKMVAEAVSLRSDLGWSLGFRALNLSLEAGEGARVTAALRLQDLVPGPAVSAALVRTGLPDLVERVDLLADVELTAPVVLRGAAAAPEVKEIAVRELRLLWGPLRVTGSGRMRAAEQGLAEGSLALRVEGWSDGLGAIEAAGIVPPAMQKPLRSVIEGLAARSSEPGVLELPLVMQNGRMMLGPVPLGAAPRLR